MDQVVPLHPEAALHEAETLLARRDLLPALKAFANAEAIGAEPDRCAAGRWMAQMLHGEFAAAWAESDAIRRRGAPDPHRFWTGEPIEGEQVILRCLHGFGDAVQMLRYAPALRSRCAALTVEVPPRMLSLAPMFEGVSDVITWGSLAPAHPPAWDVQIECMELPYLFRTHQHQLPIATNYLKLPPEIQANVTTAMGPHKMPRVGVVWAAGEWNPSRSIPFSCIFQILQTRDCEFWNLQGGRDADEWRSLPHHLSLRDARECGEGLISLAAVIEQLDLVITVDTLAAHLAGALGTPTWVLLQSAADWRWMIHRTDSPWYPSLRLYRQPNAGSWGTVFNNVTADLARWLSHARQAERAG